MYCSGKTRDGGTCSRRARFGLFCKTHLPASNAEETNTETVPETVADTVTKNTIDLPMPIDDFLKFVANMPPPFLVLKDESQGVSLTDELDPELPTLYTYVLETIERSRNKEIPLQMHIKKSRFDSRQIQTSVNQLYKLGFRVIDNKKNVLVYRPRFVNATAKHAWRAKHARLHEDRIDVLARIEEGTRIRVRDSFQINYDLGFKNGALYTFLISGLLGFCFWIYKMDTEIKPLGFR